MEELLKEMLSEIKGLKEGQKQLFDSQEQLSSGQKQLFEGQKQLSDRLDKVEQSQARMENDLGRKLGLLYDGWQLHEDKFQHMQHEIQAQFDDIRADTRYLVRRVAVIEKLAK
ncbi:MAG: hypothetical protein ABFC57_13105 [Veillonellales bacterium]